MLIRLSKILADIPTEPLEIIEKNLEIKTDRKSIWYLLDIPGLYNLFFMVTIMTGTICLLLSLIHFLMIRKREIKAEIKADIMHRIGILGLFGMAIAILDVLLLVGKMLNGS